MHGCAALHHVHKLPWGRLGNLSYRTHLPKCTILAQGAWQNCFMQQNGLARSVTRLNVSLEFQALKH